jgi:hypothetical protein
METNATKDLLEFFFHCSDSMQTFWNFYVTIVLGLIAFFASTKNPNKPMARIITIAFILFAFVNLSGLQDLTNQRLVAAEQVKINSDELAVLYKNTLNPPKFWMVATFHVILDIITISTIWIFVLKRKAQIAFER